METFVTTLENNPGKTLGLESSRTPDEVGLDAISCAFLELFVSHVGKSFGQSKFDSVSITSWGK